MLTTQDAVGKLPAELPHPEARRHGGKRARIISYLRLLEERCAAVRFETLVQVAALITGVVYCGLSFALWTATREAIDQTRVQMLFTQRPWITVTKVELSTPLAVNAPVRATVSLKNSGVSPALGVATSGTLMIRNSDPGFARRLIGRDEPRTDMGAADLQLTSFEFDDGRGLQADDLAVLQSAKQKLYAIVEITYTDTFGRLDSTNICAVYRPAQRDFGPCATGNELR